MPSLLALAPVPALVAALLAAGEPPLVLPEALLGATLALDVPGAMLLGVAALLWIAAGAYAATYLRDDAIRRTLRRVVAARAHRQHRRLHGRRRRELLLVPRHGQPRGLRPHRARRHIARAARPGSCTWPSHCWAKPAC